MQNEYLITFKQNAHLCASTEKFKNLIGAHKEITFSKKAEHHVIKFKSKEFPYTLLKQNLGNDAIGYKLTVCCEDKDLETFVELFRAIRTMIGEIKHSKLIILQDDIAKYYCVQAYPIIYETENLMRKLIYQIMNLSRGYEWRNQATPSEVEQSIKNTLNSQNENFLHNVDFIQLSCFLFNPYTEKHDFSRFLQAHIRAEESSEQIAVKDLMPYYAQNNWDRYFKDKMDVESAYLEKRWKRLYEIRNSVAHCREISRQEFEELVKISGEIHQKLKAALGEIDNMEPVQQQALAKNWDKGISAVHHVKSENSRKIKTYLHQAEKHLRAALVHLEAKQTDGMTQHLSDAAACLMEYIRHHQNIISTHQISLAINHIRNVIHTGSQDRENKWDEILSEISEAINIVVFAQDIE